METEGKSIIHRRFFLKEREDEYENKLFKEVIQEKKTIVIHPVRQA